MITAALTAKLIDRRAEPRGSHLQQHAPGFRRDAPHGPAIGLDRVRTAGSALVDGDVGAAHDARGVVVRDVQFIGHHLPEGGPGALAAVRLPNVKSCGVVFVNDDPRIELPEVGVGIGTGGAGSLLRAPRSGLAMVEAPKLTTSMPEVFRKSRRVRHCLSNALQ